MNAKKAKRLRRYILSNQMEVLFLIRNEFGSKTKEMAARQVYQNAKKLYYAGKLKLPKEQKNVKRRINNNANNNQLR